MKRFVALVLMVVCLFSCATEALALGDFLGDLTSLISGDQETYGVGQPVETDELFVELTNVMISNGNSYYTPAEGKQYVILEFEIENRSRQELTLSTLLSFNCWCDNRHMEISLEALSIGALKGKYQLDCVVEPDERISGIVGYEIPQDWKEIKVEFQKEALFGEKYVFAVNAQ